jgi:site-specific DNA-cytosine methylase
MTIVTVLSLFDGISCGQLALNKAGISYKEYYASEIDKSTIQITQKNFPKTIQLGDVNTIDINQLSKIDLLMGGTCCQPFSFAGKQLNFNDQRGKLFFKYCEILGRTNPKYFLLENVPMKKQYENIITNTLGVEPLKINSSLVSGQNRNRLYWTNIPVKELPKDKNILLKDVIKQDYDGIWVFPRGVNKGGLKNYKNKSPTITCSSWQYNFLIQHNNIKRRFTIEEAEELQTIPKNYTSGISESKRFKAVGNAWTVDIVAHILSFIS